MGFPGSKDRWCAGCGAFLGDGERKPLSAPCHGTKVRAWGAELDVTDWPVDQGGFGGQVPEEHLPASGRREHTELWVVPFTSESGDRYILGPFLGVPSHQAAVRVLSTHSPEEIVTELEAYELAGVVDLQMGGGIKLR